jgi:hypothetical protein
MQLMMSRIGQIHFGKALTFRTAHDPYAVPRLAATARGRQRKRISCAVHGCRMERIWTDTIHGELSAGMRTSPCGWFGVKRCVTCWRNPFVRDSSWKSGRSTLKSKRSVESLDLRRHQVCYRFFGPGRIAVNNEWASPFSCRCRRLSLSYNSVGDLVDFAGVLGGRKFHRRSPK